MRVGCVIISRLRRPRLSYHVFVVPEDGLSANVNGRLQQVHASMLNTLAQISRAGDDIQRVLVGVLFCFLATRSCKDVTGTLPRTHVAYYLLGFRS